MFVNLVCYIGVVKFGFKLLYFSLDYLMGDLLNFRTDVFFIHQTISHHDQNSPFMLCQ